MARGGSRFGAGRPGWHVKAEHCLRLDVRDLAQRKMLGGGSYTWRWTNTASGEEVGSVGLRIFDGLMHLDYSVGGKLRPQRIEIERTACHYGGTRPWFRCLQCQRRVAVLFLRGGNFICRHCGGVKYSSQSEDPMGRAWRLQGKLERKLGDNWQRLKGMHQTTRSRLLTRIWACEEAGDRALADYMARIGFLGL